MSLKKHKKRLNTLRERCLSKGGNIMSFLFQVKQPKKAKTNKNRLFKSYTIQNRKSLSHSWHEQWAFQSLWHVPICSNFHRHLSSTCFHYSNCNITTCTPMTAYFWFGCDRYSSHFLLYQATGSLRKDRQSDSIPPSPLKGLTKRCQTGQQSNKFLHHWPWCLCPHLLL